VHSHCKKPKTNNTLHIDLYNKRSNKFFNQLPLFQTLFALCSLSISQVSSVFSSKRPFIQVNAQGVSGSWLFDTGAAISLISVQEFRKILPQNRPPKKPILVNLTCASDQQLKTVGLYDLKLTIGSRSLVLPVYVTENKNAAILGIDAIKAFGLLYSPTKNSFSFEKILTAAVHPLTAAVQNLPAAIHAISPMPTIDLDQNSVLATLSVLKTVTLPPLTSLSLSQLAQFLL